MNTNDTILLVITGTEHALTLVDADAKAVRAELDALEAKLIDRRMDPEDRSALGEQYNDLHNQIIEISGKRNQIITALDCLKRSVGIDPRG